MDNHAKKQDWLDKWHKNTATLSGAEEPLVIEAFENLRRYSTIKMIACQENNLLTN